MCFSSEVSLLTLLIGLTGSLLVWNLGTNSDKIISGYLGYVSLMQLTEYLLWNYQKCDDFHKNISISGMILNVLQPVVLGILVLVLSPRQIYKILIYIILFVYISITFGWYVQQYTSDLQCTNPRKDDPHLVWNWTILKDYEIGWFGYIVTSMLISILGMPTLNSGIFLALGLLISMLISIIVYPRQNMGALWCFFSAFGPIGYYMLRISRVIK